jgi:disulfide bond formation protein DsbB
MTLISNVNLFFSILTAVGQLMVVVIIVSLVFRNERLIKFFGGNAILFSFIIALFATLGSLFYSEILGYEPCKLCWFQRIFIYPQVILLGIALWKKNGSTARYNSIALSAVGAIIAGYHYLLQIGVAPEIPCSALGYSVACSQAFVMSFGYITIPMMALTVFAMIIVLFLANKIHEDIQ